ncbi:MAG: WYL domain-containing protein, partial [Myxococcales bacterium]|nr:WYL domain-containing protein [Myxococcales bacterium]
AHGVPVATEAEGYRLDARALLPPLQLNEAESEALVLGSRIAAAWGGPELAVAAGSALDKLEAVLPESARAALRHTPLFAPGGPWAREAATGLDALRLAIALRRRVTCAYMREDGTETERVLRPVALQFWGTKWTLGAWCELRQAWRTFRIDRIADLRLLEEAWPEEDGVDLAGYLEAQRREQVAIGLDADGLGG